MLGNNGISLTNPGNNNSNLEINFQTLLSPTFSLPGFNYSYNPASLPLPQNYEGPWVNTPPGNTLSHPIDLRIRLKLQANFLNQTCPAIDLSLSPLVSNIDFLLKNSCGINSTLVLQPYLVSSVPLQGLPSVPIFAYQGQGNPSSPGGPYPFTATLSIPTQDPFQIDIRDSSSPFNSLSTAISCSLRTYRVYLSTDVISSSSGNSSNVYPGAINVQVNNVQVPTTLLANNVLAFDLPFVPTSTSAYQNFNVELEVSDMYCPPGNGGQGQLRYHLRVEAICDDCQSIPSNNPGSVRQLFCLSTDVILHCTGLCQNPLDTKPGFIVQRKTFGWASESDYLNGLAPFPDAAALENHIISQPAPPSQAFIDDQINRMYPHDLFDLHAEGSIQPISNNLGSGNSHDNLIF